MSIDHRKLDLKEDWPAIPYVTLILVGMAMSAYDLILLQGLRIQLYPMIIGAAFVIFGGLRKGHQQNDAKESGLWAGKQYTFTRY